MKRLLTPAITILNSLKYPQKFILIGLIFVIPLGVVMYYFISEADYRIKFAHKERLGVTYISALASFLQHSIQYSGLVSVYYEKDASFEERLKALAGQVDSDARAIDSIDKQLGSILGTSEEWNALRDTWQELQEKAHSEAMLPDEKGYHLLHKGVVSLIIKAGDTSNLILDPDLDSYYLMDAFVNKLPMIADSLDEMRSRGMRGIIQKEIESESERLLLSSLYGSLENTLSLMHRGMKTAFGYNPALFPKLEMDVQEGLGASVSLLQTLSTSVINAELIAISPADYYEGFSKAIDRAFELYRAISPQLDELLQKRIHGFVSRKYFVEVLALIMLVFVLYFTIAFYASVKATVSKLDLVAEGMSRDAPINEVSLESKDELGEVARAFNKIGMKLRESYMRLEAINEELEEDIVQRREAEEEVRRLNKELEQRVIERTQELDKANEELKKDILRRQKIERNLWVQYSITRLFSSASSFNEVSIDVLQIIAEDTGWDAGAFWLVDAEARRIRCVELWHIPSLEMSEFEKVSRESSFSFGEGFVGHIWKESAFVWIEDISSDTNFQRAPSAFKAGFSRAFGFPVRFSSEVLGVLEFYSRSAPKPDNDTIQMLDVVGAQLVQFIKRSHAEEEIQKLSRSVEQSPNCVVITDTLGNIEYVNPQFTRLTGYTVKEALGKNPRVLKSGEMPKEIYTQLWQTITSGKEWRGELHNRKKNGALYWEFASISPLISATGQISHFVAVKEDITARKLTEQRLSVQYSVTRLLAGASSLNEVSLKILQIVCENLGWDTGAIWIHDQAANLIRCAGFWHMPLSEVAEFEKVSREITFSEGVGLPGRVWKENAASWIEDVTVDTNFPRAPYAAKAGLHGAFGFPIRVGEKVVGMFEFFSHELRKPDDELLAMFDSIGDQIGQLIKRTQAEEEIRNLNQGLELRIYERTIELQDSYKNLQELNNFNNLLLTTIPFGMDIVDEEGNILFMSQKFRESFGKDVTGKKCWELYKDNKRQCAECPLKEGVALDQTSTLEVSEILGNRIFQISHTGMVYKNQKAILEIFEDITERKRAEEKVRFFSSIAIAVAEAQDMQSAFTIVLQKIGEATGWFYGEMWIPSLDGTRLECGSSVFMREGENFEAFRKTSLRYTFAPGVGLPGRAWLSKNLAVIRNLEEDKNFPRLQAALAAGLKSGIAIPILAGEDVVSVMDFFTSRIENEQDISQLFQVVALQLGSVLRRKQVEEELKRAYNELKQAQSQLVQSAKMASVGQLAGGVAHEINNPLTGVLNNVQLIKMELAEKSTMPPENFKQILDVIEESALRCAKITRSLLDFSHAAKESFHLLSVNEMVAKVVILIGHEMKLQNIVITQELAPDIPQVHGDSQLLQQVIFDMVSNSRWAVHKKFNAQGGIITIKTSYEPQKGNVCLLISDNGIGIPQENLARIFDPFFTTKPVGEGTGLGLAIVYGIIKEHKGSIEVESKVGEGTAFKISLPALEKS